MFSVTVKDLMLKKNRKFKKGMLSDHSVSIPYFDLGGEMVWGATSMVLSEFKDILKDVL